MLPWIDDIGTVPIAKRILEAEPLRGCGRTSSLSSPLDGSGSVPNFSQVSSRPAAAAAMTTKVIQPKARSSLELT